MKTAMAAAENGGRGCGREVTVDGREVAEEPQIWRSRQRVMDGDMGGRGRRRGVWGCSLSRFFSYYDTSI